MKSYWDAFYVISSWRWVALNRQLILFLINLLLKVTIAYLYYRSLLKEWYNIIKQNATAIKFIDECLNEIRYPHSFNRQPRSFENYDRWKASELRCFMIYTTLPMLVKLCLNISYCFPEVRISNFFFLFIYVRVLRHFDDHNEIRSMAHFTHAYLRHFASLYGPCKELFSVHGLLHLWQQVEEHDGLSYHRYEYGSFHTHILRSFSSFAACMHLRVVYKFFKNLHAVLLS